LKTETNCSCGELAHRLTKLVLCLTLLSANCHTVFGDGIKLEADGIESVGTKSFRAEGNVTVEKGSLKITSKSLLSRPEKLSFEGDVKARLVKDAAETRKGVSPKSERLILLSADKINIGMNGFEMGEIELLGQAKITQSANGVLQSEGKADRIVISKDQEELALTGNASISDTLKRIDCPKIFYNMKTEKMKTVGTAKLAILSIRAIKGMQTGR